MSARAGLRRAGASVSGGARRWATDGVQRVRSSLVPVLQGAVGAAVAITLAQLLLGHPYPFFAGVAAFLSLGLSDERRLRRVGELALGVSLGVGIGDAVVLTLGRGPLQVAGVVVLTVLAARFVDSGHLVATQSGVQSLLVVALPPGSGGPFARLQDALVGSVVALAVAVLLAVDPRRLPQQRAGVLLGALTRILRQLASALRTADVTVAERALERSRATQPLVEAAAAAVRGGREVARIAPLRRRHRGELAELDVLVRSLDLAARNTRVLARRTVRAVEGEHRLPRLAAAVEGVATATARLRSDVTSGAGVTGARGPLREVSRTLTVEGVSDVQEAAAVQMVRALVVDLFEATGMSHAQSRRELPPV